MKSFFLLSCLSLLGTAVLHPASAQLLNRVRHEVKNRAENHVINDAGDATDKAIDKTENAAVSSIIKDSQGEGADSQAAKSPAISGPSPVGDAASPAADAAAAASYKNYDFVPGDHIIFETDFAGQRDAELPARLGLLDGSAEIQTFQNTKVLHLEKGNRICMVPVMDSARYLPDQFTVEFDFLYNDPDPTSFNQVSVNFYMPDKNDNYIKDNDGDYHFLLYEADQLDFGPSITGKELSDALISDLRSPGKWHHVAIYVHNQIGKAYIDQYRVAASNMLPKGISQLAIKSNGRMEYMIKNFRLAGGGSDAYHEIMTSGKLVTHGIHFASGKADILPESMGTINEVFHILDRHPDLKLEIDGYTDNDGTPDANLKLSKERAEAVKGQLVTMGIDTARLGAKGLGEAFPVASNDTPEGKASNRRVEFLRR